VARRLRAFSPGISVHVMQRGNNRQAVFEGSGDFEAFLEILQEGLSLCEVALHAYVLMTNHFHLLLTPSQPDSVPKLMKRVDGGYAQRFNYCRNRTGAVWEGRYRARVILEERYWLTCLRYIEQNPVKAGLSPSASSYRWSSNHAHTLGTWPSWLSSHWMIDGLGTTIAVRQAALRLLTHEGQTP
jgi:putative transposase